MLLVTLSCDLERSAGIENEKSKRIFLRVVLMGIICSTAICLPYFSDMMNLIGAVSNTMLIFVLPVICERKLYPSKSFFKDVAHFFILGMGLFGGILGTFDALVDLANKIRG